MAAGEAYVFPGFLTPVLRQLSFQSHQLLFSHASAEVRGENTPERKSGLNWGSNSQPPGHESDMLTTEPPGRGGLFSVKNGWQIGALILTLSKTSPGFYMSIIMTMADQS